jgi:hypothetical protein
MGTNLAAITRVESLLEFKAGERAFQGGNKVRRDSGPDGFVVGLVLEDPPGLRATVTRIEQEIIRH